MKKRKIPNDYEQTKIFERNTQNSETQKRNTLLKNMYQEWLKLIDKNISESNQISEYNGIQYIPHACEHKVCATGCCPMCDKELAWITKEYYSINNRA